MELEGINLVWLLFYLILMRMKMGI